MRKLIVLILVFLAATAWGQSSSLNKDRIFDQDSLIVDVRTPDEYASGHIKNAVNIPFNTILEDIKYFAPDKERTIVLYCQTGSRADLIEKKLKYMGYKNIINARKYKDLKKLEATLE